MQGRDPDQFERWLRARSGGPSPLPDNFRALVWSRIRTGEDPAGGLPWLEGTAFAGLSPLRLAVSYSLAALLFSAVAGFLLTSAPRPRKADLFPALRSAPELFALHEPAS